MLLVIALLATAIASIYLFLISNYNYWSRKGVRGPKPAVFVGNYPSVWTQKRHGTYDLRDAYEAFKNSDNFVGIYNCRSPQLLITDHELAHKILTTHFKHFHDNEISSMVSFKSDFIFASNPFSLTGNEWKERRAEVTPGFTISRIKSVYPVTKKVCRLMLNYIDDHEKMNAKESLEGKDLSLRFTTEVVSDCVLGIEAASFTSKPMPIKEKISKLFDLSYSFIAYTIVVGLVPSMKRLWKLRFIPRHMETFFVSLLSEALHMRRSLLNKGLAKDRVDFLNYMLQLQDKKELSIMQVTAHTMTFLFDGFETSASVLSHTLLFLARDLERQQKLRDEILNNIDEANEFESILALPYLDACIHEAIRIFPPAFFSNKLCTEPIELTNKNGQKLLVPKNTVVVLPMHAIMMDERLYDNPDKFEPERFLEENNGGLKHYRDKGAYYGFGEGPRMCLGMRFALAQLKSGIVEIIRNYEVHVNPKTRKDNLFDPKYFLSRLEGGIWLDFKRI